MAHNLAVFAVGHPLHVHHGLDVAGFHLHDNGHAGLAVYELQLFHYGGLGNVLHPHIDGRHDVVTVHGVFVHHTEIGAAHPLYVSEAGSASEHTVERHLESEAWRVHLAVQVADDAFGE